VVEAARDQPVEDIGHGGEDEDPQRLLDLAARPQEAEDRISASARS